MGIRSILALTDFSSKRHDWVLERAACLAAGHRANLELVNFPVARSRHRAPAAAALEQAARSLAQRHRLPAVPLTRVADGFAQIARKAAAADLVVLADWRECTLAALWFGQPIERLLRLCRSPVLVVGAMPRGRYARILTAVDFTAQSHALARAAAQIEPSAALELFHAVSLLPETKFRSAGVSAEAVESHRQDCARYARGRLFRLAASPEVSRRHFHAVVGRGEPGRQAVLRQQQIDADLLVVGRRRSSRLVDFMLGSTARQVLRRATSDVLIVPPGSAPLARGAAVPRPELAT